MRTLWLSIVFLFSTLLHTALQAANPSYEIAPNLTQFTLDNGLQVIVIPDRRAPVVTHMVWYRAGAADEPPGKSGIAHYLEHLMFKGTPTYPGGEFSKVIASVGGQENAFTSHDYTGYYQRVHKDHLETMMRYEADRMTNLILTPEIVGAERKVVLEERASRTDNNPSAQLGETHSAMLFAHNGYGIPVIGWEHEIKKLTAEDAIDFYKRFYQPDNAILVVAGDVDADQVRAFAQKTYGKVANIGETPKRPRIGVPALSGDRVVRLTDAKVRQPHIRLGFLVPSYSTAEDGEAEALDLFSEIIAGGTTARLYKNLVVDQKIATGAGGWYQGSALGETRMMVYAVPRDGKTLDDMRSALIDEINKILKDGVTQDELDRARNRLLSSTIYAQDSQQSLARMFGAALTSGSTIEDVQAWPKRLQAITVEDMVNTTKKYLIIDEMVEGYLQAKKIEG